MNEATADRRARFEPIAREVAPAVLRYAQRRTDPASAEEVVAETMLVAWRKLDDIPAGAELPWCYNVARNLLLNQHRATRRQAALVARLAAMPAPRAPHDRDDDLDLTAAMEQLRDEDREVLRLWAWEDLNPAQIAVALSISGNAASLRLYRAKKRLTKILTRSGKDSGLAGQEQGKGRRSW